MTGSSILKAMSSWLVPLSLVVLCTGVLGFTESGDTTTASDRQNQTVYQRWLDEDIRWIVTPEERDAFIKLSKDEERDRFVEQFWLRRDPTPATAENEFKEEHYRRMAYANLHFAASVPGWRTDRGRSYIVNGPPSAVKMQSSRDDEGSIRPTLLWHYHSLAEPGKDFDLRFVDVCTCGDYRLEKLPKE